MAEKAGRGVRVASVLDACMLTIASRRNVFRDPSLSVVRSFTALYGDIVPSKKVHITSGQQRSDNTEPRSTSLRRLAKGNGDGNTYGDSQYSPFVQCRVCRRQETLWHRIPGRNSVEVFALRSQSLADDQHTALCLIHPLLR